MTMYVCPFFVYFHYFLEFTLIIELHTTLLSQEEKKNQQTENISISIH